MTIRVLEVMGRSAGGIGRHVAELVSKLDSDDLIIEVAGPPGLSLPITKDPLPLEIPVRPGPGLVTARRALRRLVHEGAYDVVHSHGLRASLVSLGGARRRPLIATLHNLIRPEIAGRLRSPLYRRGEAAVVRRAAHVFAVSEEMAVQLRRYAAEADKVDVLPIGIEPPVSTRSRTEVRAELGAIDRPLIVTVARLVRQKALDVLLRATSEIDEAVLVVLGDGYLREELLDLASDFGISERVRFLGWRETVGDYLHAADVFALSSIWEARALAAQEAILAGIPVVSTDVGGMPELIEDRVSGRLVPSGDHAALAAALRDVLQDPQVAGAYANAARERLEASYSAATMLDRVRRAYLRYADA